jgi:hypothetical protein
MQHIPRVIRYTQYHSFVTWYIPYARHDLLSTRRSEDVTAYSSRQHAITDEARPCGFVA